MCSVLITVNILQVNAEVNQTSTGYKHQNMSETLQISMDGVMSKITLYLNETNKQVFLCEFILKDQTVHSEGTQVEFEGKWTNKIWCHLPLFRMQYFIVMWHFNMCFSSEIF